MRLKETSSCIDNSSSRSIKILECSGILSLTQREAARARYTQPTFVSAVECFHDEVSEDPDCSENMEIKCGLF